MSREAISMNPDKAEKRSRRKWLSAMLHWALLGLVGGILGVYAYIWNANQLAGNRLPMPFGYGFSVVLSGSMEPELSVNDLIVVRASDSYAVGDVVVYQSKGELIVHRVVELNGQEVVTKGDANNAADAPIAYEQLKGKVVGRVPEVGVVIQALKTPVGFCTVLLLAILLLWLPGRARRKEAKAERERILAEMDRLRHRQRRFPQMDSNTPDKADTSPGHTGSLKEGCAGFDKGDSDAPDAAGTSHEKGDDAASDTQSGSVMTEQKGSGNAPGESRQTKAD